jgi:hypothetical protein
MQHIGRAAIVFLSLLAPASAQTAAPSTDEARAIAKEAFLYAYPMVENYFSMYSWAIDKNGDQYKGPMNAIANVPRVFGPKDTAVVTPNSDTPYSYLIMDLRREPLVVTLPAIEKDRYYSLQIVDLYSNNVDYLGTRRDGNGGGSFMIAGPGWRGEKPNSVKRVVRLSTELAFSQFRTQLKNSADLGNVKAIQAGYKVQPLSTFLGTNAAPAPPAIDYPPITSRDQIVSDTFRFENFLLQFCPVLESERALRERFETIGIAPGRTWPPKLSDVLLQAIDEGRKEGLTALDQAAAKITSSIGYFGTPDEMAGKYVERAVGARVGLYGNSPAEAVYPAYQADSQGESLDSAKHNYTITLPKEGMPADAFWSLTMYDGKTRLLVDNPLNRYLINSEMVPNLRRNKDGSVTLYLQKDPPGNDKDSNWLPAPNGPIWLVLRLYLPKKAVIDGAWKAPPVERAGS